MNKYEVELITKGITVGVVIEAVNKIQAIITALSNSANESLAKHKLDAVKIRKI